MRLNTSTIGILLVSIVIIVAALVMTRSANAPGVDEDQTTPDATAESLAGPLFGDINQNNVTSYTIRNNADDSFITVTKDLMGTWQVEGTHADDTQELDQTQAASTMDVITTLNATDGFTVEGIAAFGLAEPAYTLSFTAQSTPHTVDIGKLNPAGSAYYAQVDGDESTVYLLSTSNINNLTKMIADIPYIAVATAPEPVVGGAAFPDMLASDIVSFSVTDAENDAVLSLSKTSDLTWVVDEATQLGAGVELDSMAIDSAVSIVLGLQTSTSFDNAELSDFGLDAPHYTLTMTTVDDVALSLQLGDAVAGREYYALINDDADTVYQIKNADMVNIVTSLAMEAPYMVEVTPEPEATAGVEMTPDVESTESPEMTPEPEATAEPGS